jgi:uncharacterized membrane protein YedE/YeeE
MGTLYEAARPVFRRISEEEVMNGIFGIWPWYIAGPLIGIFVPGMLICQNKKLGISSAFEHICMLMLPDGKKAIFHFNKEENEWKAFFVAGIMIGSFVAAHFLSSTHPHFLPDKYYSVRGCFDLFVGGLLVGFGTRYANGCTSGHTIFGLSLLQWSSLRATLAFFAGGLIYTFFAYHF